MQPPCTRAAGCGSKTSPKNSLSDVAMAANVIRLSTVAILYRNYKACASPGRRLGLCSYGKGAHIVAGVSSPWVRDTEGNFHIRSCRDEVSPVRIGAPGRE